INLWRRSIGSITGDTGSSLTFRITGSLTAVWFDIPLLRTTCGAFSIPPPARPPGWFPPTHPPPRTSPGASLKTPAQTTSKGALPPRPPTLPTAPARRRSTGRPPARSAPAPVHSRVVRECCCCPGLFRETEGERAEGRKVRSGCSAGLHGRECRRRTLPLLGLLFFRLEWESRTPAAPMARRAAVLPCSFTSAPVAVPHRDRCGDRCPFVLSPCRPAPAVCPILNRRSVVPHGAHASCPQVWAQSVPFPDANVNRHVQLSRQLELLDFPPGVQADAPRPCLPGDIQGHQRGVRHQGGCLASHLVPFPHAPGCICPFQFHSQRRTVEN
ncbi:MAG: hypothetical protein BJ554DRAFT_1454, partial [Olpidium bornovanus]